MLANSLRCIFLVILICISTFGSEAWGRIHRAPIVLKADAIENISRYPIRFYRLYRSSYRGVAKAIPFQIDEVNELGDFVLDQGESPNLASSNGYFDNLDELAFMGDDVGPVKEPQTWPKGRKPHLVYEIKITNPKGSSAFSDGAVYVGLFFNNPPPVVQKKYVVFDPIRDLVKTSRYEYVFDRKNYLVVKHIDMLQGEQRVRMVDSSTFYMKADLKYFLTVDANHRSVNSKLEAYKSGPVRSIVRVKFLYSFLNLNFEVGMYTEVSFFSNSVILPAIIYNPINGINRLNSGSGFYYGFALNQSPKKFEFHSNMKELDRHRDPGIIEMLSRRLFTEELYWASLMNEESMMYVELRPSKSMLKEGNIPAVFLDAKDSSALASRSNDKPLPLGQSPVNMALYFDLTRFSEGDHEMAFQLFFENKRDAKTMDSFKSLQDWNYNIKRI